MIWKGHRDSTCIYVCLTLESILFKSEFFPGPQKWRQPETQGDSFSFPILSPLNKKCVCVLIVITDTDASMTPRAKYLHTHLFTTFRKVEEKQVRRTLRLRKLNASSEEPQLTSSSAVTGRNAFRLRKVQYPFLFTAVSKDEKRWGKLQVY